MPGFLKIGFLVLAVPEEAIGSPFDAFRGLASGKFRIGWPVFFQIVTQLQGKEKVDKVIVGSLFSEQGDGAFGGVGGQRVMLVPERVAAAG